MKHQYRYRLILAMLDSVRPRILSVSLLLAGATFQWACSSVERSRTLGDPRVSATTIAQQVCVNCHGVHGVSVSPNFPNLAAQLPDYVAAQLKAFKGHGRLDPAGFEYMWGLSSRLDESQIAGLAEYYAKQIGAPARSYDPVLEKRGKLIFDSGVAATGVPACASCHGAKGEGMAAFPRLAGQHADYVVKQLKVFQRTDERPEGVIMKTVAHALTQDNIESVAAYVQAIPPSQ